MDVFFTLLMNLVPLYVLIGLGFVAGKFFQVDRDTLANLAIFIFLPIIVFGFIVDLKFQLNFVILPVVLYFVQAIIGLGFLALGRKIYHGPEANILAMAASMGNTGYFGLPLALLVLTPEQVAIYIFAMIGGTAYEATIGYYIAVRGRYNVRDSLIKLLKFPSLYAIAIALLVNVSNVELPEMFYTYWTYFKGAYVVIGMMIIGAALAKITKFEFGPRFLSLVFIGKFVGWPGLVFLWVLADRHFFHMFDQSIYNLMLVMSVVPPAANIVSFAAQLDLVPEKAATTILLSTVFALFYIPCILLFLGVF